MPEVVEVLMVDPNDSSAILRRIGEAYRGCETYHDEGGVFIDGASVGTFKTSYERRAGRLSFTFVDADGSEYVYEAEHGELVTFRVPDSFPISLRCPADLNRAVATITGITSGAAYVVPRLIVPTIGGGLPWSPMSASFVDKNALSGKVRISVGLSVPRQDISIVVDCENFTIVQYVARAARAADVVPEHLRMSVGMPVGLLVPETAIEYQPKLVLTVSLSE